MRVLLDSNAVDPIVELPGALDFVANEVTAGRVELLMTPTGRREIGRTPDEAVRARLESVLGYTAGVLDGAFVFDRTGFNEGVFVEDTSDFEAVRAGNVKNINDAVIALSAKMEAAALVTNDKQLRSNAPKIGLQVLRPLEFLALIGYRPAADI
jgi:hypothetical protein